MPTMYDVPINDLIERLAESLKNISGIKPPQWAVYVKTGMHKERPPAKEDWWYTRCSSILRAVREKGPIGVSKLRTKYGGRKNRGYKPDKFYRGSGNIIRKALQQLETAGLIKKAEVGAHKGRVITPKGTSLIDNAASQLYKPKKKQETKPVEKPAAEKEVKEIKEVKKKGKNA